MFFGQGLRTAAANGAAHMSSLSHGNIWRALLARGDERVFVVCAALACFPSVRLFCWKLAESNLFLVDRAYFEETFLRVGGPLDYASHAVTALSACPWTALPGVAVLWFLQTRLLRRLSGVDDAAWSWLNALPGALALVLAACMGGDVWLTSSPDIVSQILLGVLAVLACLRLAVRPGVALALTPLLYLACGAWAFLFAFAVLGRAWTTRAARSPSALVWAASPLALLAVLPYALVRGGFLTLSPLEAYALQVTMLAGHRAAWNALLASVPVVTLLLLFFGQVVARRVKSRAAAPCVFLGLVVLAFVAAYDPQFGTLLAVEKAAKEARWEDVLRLGGNDPQPHRLVVAYRILALYKTGRIADDLFKRPLHFSRASAALDIRCMNGALLYYEYGLPSFARKTLVGDVGDFGWSPERLRLLGMTACITSEFRVARLYFERLARQPFYRREAEKWLRILRGKEKAPADFTRVCSTFRLFAKQDPRLTMGPHTSLEEDIYASYQKLRTECPTETAVFFLCIALLERDLGMLTSNPLILEEAKRDGELPQALQEGLLIALLTASDPARREQIDYAALGIARRTLERWNDFARLKDKWASDPRRQRDALREAFGATYWCYYACKP